MPYVTVGRENSGEIRIYYEDHGSGAPVVLVHGYLADAHSWEKQEAALLTAGYRAISYDRRGGGASSRPAAVKTFLDQHYNIDMFGGVLVSDQAWQNSFYTATRVSAAAALGCAAAWREDFRADLGRVTVPVLIVEGGQDRIVPPAATDDRLAGMPASARRSVISDGGHAIIWTHAEEVNRELLRFIDAI